MRGLLSEHWKIRGGFFQSLEKIPCPAGEPEGRAAKRLPFRSRAIQAGRGNSPWGERKQGRRAIVLPAGRRGASRCRSEGCASRCVSQNRNAGSAGRAAPAGVSPSHPTGLDYTLGMARFLPRRRSQHETVTALGKRGEAVERSGIGRGGSGRPEGLPPGKGGKRFAEQTREENPARGWVCRRVTAQGKARKAGFDPLPPNEHKWFLCDVSASRRGTSWPTRAKRTHKNDLCASGAFRALPAFVPPACKLSGCDPKKANREQSGPEGGTTDGSVCERFQKAD